MTMLPCLSIGAICRADAFLSRLLLNRGHSGVLFGGAGDGGRAEHQGFENAIQKASTERYLDIACSNCIDSCRNSPC